MKRILLAATLAGCAAESSAAPVPYGESAVLTDTNDDPNIVEVYLVAGHSIAEYLPGKPTGVWAYRDGAVPGAVGTVPGPTLRAKLGDQIIVHFRNELHHATTVHWHGPRVPFRSDGSHTSQVPVEPGQAFDYRFVVRDAGSFWYHPHVHGYEQIERGLYGTIVFEGGVTPDVTADRYLVLDDVKIADDGSLPDGTSDHDLKFGRQGNLLVVNGRRAPVDLQVGVGARERWRIVNAANGRYFNLRIPGTRFFVIGTDGGLLPTPYWTETLLIVPGERYDVLVTFDGLFGPLQTIHYERGQQEAPSDPRQLIRLRRGPPVMAREPLPTRWRDLPRMEVTSATPVRRVALGETRLPGGSLVFTINGAAWPDNFDQAIDLGRGDVEIWEIANDTAMDHPVHLHGTFFEVLPDQAGWKDTINVRRRSATRFAVQFDEPGTWMLHCHILEHADDGMMLNVFVRQ